MIYVIIFAVVVLALYVVVELNVWYERHYGIKTIIQNAVKM